MKIFVSTTFRYYKDKMLLDQAFLGGFFSHDHSRIIGLQGKGEGIYLTPHYHFHPLYRHLDIRRAITAESSPLRIGSSRTRTGNLWDKCDNIWVWLFQKILVSWHFLCFPGSRSYGKKTAIFLGREYSVVYDLMISY